LITAVHHELLKSTVEEPKTASIF